MFGMNTRGEQRTQKTYENKLRWKSDFDKQVLIQNFEKRGWVKASGDGKCFCLRLIDLYRGLEHILGKSMDCQTDFQS